MTTNPTSHLTDYELADNGILPCPTTPPYPTNVGFPSTLTPPQSTPTTPIHHLDCNGHNYDTSKGPMPSHLAPTAPHNSSLPDWHKVLANYLLCNPTARTSIIAQTFDLTPATINRIRSSEAFHVYFTSLLESEQRLTRHQVVARAGEIALTSLQAIHHKITTDKTLTLTELVRAGETSAKMTGVGLPVTNNSHTTQTLVLPSVDAATLTRARYELANLQRLNTHHIDATPLANSVSTNAHNNETIHIHTPELTSPTEPDMQSITMNADETHSIDADSIITNIDTNKEQKHIHNNTNVMNARGAGFEHVPATSEPEAPLSNIDNDDDDDTDTPSITSPSLTSAIPLAESITPYEQSFIDDPVIHNAGRSAASPTAGPICSIPLSDHTYVPPVKGARIHPLHPQANQAAEGGNSV